MGTVPDKVRLAPQELAAKRRGRLDISRRYMIVMLLSRRDAPTSRIDS